MAAPFLAIRQYNPASDKAHQAFLGHLARLNEAVARTGLAKTEYLAWKVTGKQAGPFGYVHGSLWPDEAAYKAVQNHDAVRAVIARFKESGVEPFKESAGNHYVLLNPPSGTQPPVPWDRVRHLSMTAHTLSAPKHEAQFMAILEEGSAAVARAGHPETRYDLWRITGKQDGPFSHLFGSLWADDETYEAVHDHPAHRAFEKRHRSAIASLLKGGVQSRYNRIKLK